MIFWCQKLIADIRKSFSDIRKSVDIRKCVNFWYQKIIFWYQKTNFWYQKIIFWYQKICTIFLYQKLVFWYQKMIFWYQKFTHFLISENQCEFSRSCIDNHNHIWQNQYKYRPCLWKRDVAIFINPKLEIPQATFLRLSMDVTFQTTKAIELTSTWHRPHTRCQIDFESTWIQRHLILGCRWCCWVREIRKRIQPLSGEGFTLITFSQFNDGSI